MYHGDYSAGDLVDFKFTTRSSIGVPTTLAGTPALAVYKASSDTQSTAGIVLTPDFDGVTGLNHVRIDLADVFYAAENDFVVVVTTGTVGGTSVAGEVVGSFSIGKRSAYNRLGAPVGATVSADILAVTKILEADMEIDKTGTPWKLVFKEKGTENVLFEKILRDVDGNDLSSTETVIGSAKES